MEENDIKLNGLYQLEPVSDNPNDNWCKLNILLAGKDERGLVFYDVYWADGHTNYPFEKVKDRITFVFDLNGSKEVKRNEFDQYKEEDKFYIPQGGQDESYLIRRDAEKSREIIIEIMEDKIKDRKNEIKSLQNNIRWRIGVLKEIKDGGDINNIFL